MINQAQFQKLQVLCNDILQNIAINNIEMAKKKRWLLHEVICTKHGKNYGKEEKDSDRK